jgi:hypothetical protein
VTARVNCCHTCTSYWSLHTGFRPAQNHSAHSRTPTAGPSHHRRKLGTCYVAPAPIALLCMVPLPVHTTMLAYVCSLANFQGHHHFTELVRAGRGGNYGHHAKSKNMHSTECHASSPIAAHLHCHMLLGWAVQECSALQYL